MCSAKSYTDQMISRLQNVIICFQTKDQTKFSKYSSFTLTFLLSIQNGTYAISRRQLSALLVNDSIL